MAMIVKCYTHKEIFKLPASDEEFISGSLHEEVEKCQVHSLENPDCIMEEITDE